MMKYAVTCLHAFNFNHSIADDKKKGEKIISFVKN